jgi:hypothetical protein
MARRLTEKRFMFTVTALMMGVLILTAQTIRADGPVTIGVNGSGPLTRSANIGWIRSGDYWANINPGFQQWNFAHADLVISEAESQSQKVLFVLSGAPPWCGGGPRWNTPCPIEFWKTYVDEVSRRYRGRVAAYEIWNEPDLINQAAFGVGWDRWDMKVYPTYVDYFVEAARIIRLNDPAAKIVGPALAGSDTRAVTIWQLFQNTNYADGNASNFVDVISFHHNGKEGQHSEDVANNIRSRMILIQRWNPRNYTKPVWITEFGWKVGPGQISEDSQRTRIKNLLIEMGGGGFGILRGYNIPQAFIYVLRTCDGDETWGIFRCEPQPFGSPRPVVWQYLQTLPFPAKQDPAVPRE